MLSLEKDAASAQESFYVQAMTFEGDSAGERLIKLMIESPAKDKRLIIDSFSRYVVSDHFVFGSAYLKDRSFRDEIARTYALIDKARQHGIQVHFVNPVGPFMLRYPLRNHKKLVVLDGKVNYLGGINFSEHNFEWLDFMIRGEEQALSQSVKEDFLATWQGVNQSAVKEIGHHTLFLTNGINSKEEHEILFNTIKKAKRNVIIVSPYLSNPLLSLLKNRLSKEVTIDVITPIENNKGLFANLMRSTLSEGRISGWLFPGMFHMKCVLVDDNTLIFGSSNFDLISYYFEQEIVLKTKNQNIIAELKKKVIEPMTEKAVRYHAENTIPPPWQIGALEMFCKLASKSILRPKKSA